VVALDSELIRQLLVHGLNDLSRCRDPRLRAPRQLPMLVPFARRDQVHAVALQQVPSHRRADVGPVPVHLFSSGRIGSFGILVIPSPRSDSHHLCTCRWLRYDLSVSGNTAGGVALCQNSLLAS
jgi:hypothetical protein